MTNGLLICGEIYAHFLIYYRTSSYMTLKLLKLLPSEFPYKWGKLYFLFYQCRYWWEKGWVGVDQQKTTAKSVGFFLYTPFTGIHEGSVVDPYPDSALHLNAGVGSGFREPKQCGSMRIRILVRFCRHKKLYFYMKIILYTGNRYYCYNKSYLRIYKSLSEGWNSGLLVYLVYFLAPGFGSGSAFQIHNTS
jgi:hypothetical protein